MIHGTNLSTLHEHIPRDVVPSDLGGEGRAYKPEEWIQILENYENKWGYWLDNIIYILLFSIAERRSLTSILSFYR